jgi:hypothetical protein
VPWQTIEYGSPHRQKTQPSNSPAAPAFSTTTVALVFSQLCDPSQKGAIGPAISNAAKFLRRENPKHRILLHNSFRLAFDKAVRIGIRAKELGSQVLRYTA